ncbi:hypothetical protein GIB67_030239 [Kingdonia uniflora]|uniref:Phytocyanin domain-containing protein n=1 Tax=Kingdonia uniflora TaxID=39325 RepID=A0A7J7MMX1_9MAGN|nr:hypothetical protein GIB67_030239 [Kingdonia uniflora]
MGFVDGARVFSMVCMACISVSMAAVYKVGDTDGWTAMGNPDYVKWASSKTFAIGDTIVFEYNPQWHDVVQVSEDDFESCKATSPIETYKTGNDSITIKTDDNHYYICGIPGHCEKGQKVAIEASTSTSSNTTTTAKAPAASSTACHTSIGLIAKITMGSFFVFVGLGSFGFV